MKPRRLELDEADGSTKFWQIALLEGKELTLRIDFGKTDGKGLKTQIKKLSSQTALEDEVTRLIADKTKQGFVEVGGDPADVEQPATKKPVAPAKEAKPAKQPAAKTPAKTPAKIANDEAAVTPAIASPAIASPGITWIKPALVLLEKAKAVVTRRCELPASEADVAQGLSAALNNIRLGLDLSDGRFTPEARELVDRAVAYFENRLSSSAAPLKSDAEFDATLEAVVFLLTEGEDSRASFVVRWIETVGFPRALDVLATMWRYQCEQTGTLRPRPRSLTFAPSAAKNWSHPVAHQAAQIFGLAFARLKSDEKAAACAHAIELRLNAALPTRIGLAAGVDGGLGGSLANEDGAALLAEWAATPGFSQHDARVLLRLISDPDVLEKVYTRFSHDSFALQPALVAERVGIPGAKLILQWIKSVDLVAWKLDATTILSTLECVESARFLHAHREKKGFMPIAHEFFTRRPDLDPKAPALKAAAADQPTFADADAADVPKVLQQARSHDPKAAALPAWFDPDKLPPILLRAAKGKTQTRLPSDAVRQLARLLSSPAPEPDLDTVIAACTPESLSQFAWEIFHAWLLADTGKKDDWAMSALGYLGGDDAARKLTPYIRAWPGEALHARAVKGLDVLAQIGTDVALMNLDAIAEKLKFKALKESARKKVEEIASKRGLTRDQLADRIAPTLDLDNDGSRVLSFGDTSSRTFRVGFDENLAPFVVASDDPKKKKCSDLPKPRASDDAEKAAEATLIWKTLKKDAKAIAALQISRLERAMCTQRRWTASELSLLLINHPLLFHVVRRLVWAVYDDSASDDADALAKPKMFRVAEDRTLADESDAAFALPADAIIGIPHRLEMSDDAVRQWGELFASYEILSPFPQLERDVYRIHDDERKATSLERMTGVVIPTKKLIALEANGWRKGAPGDAGWIYEMKKTVASSTRSADATSLTVHLKIAEGISAGGWADSPQTQILGAASLKHAGKAEHYTGPSAAYETLSPIIFSELVRELESLR